MINIINGLFIVLCITTIIFLLMEIFLNCLRIYVVFAEKKIKNKEQNIKKEDFRKYKISCFSIEQIKEVLKTLKELGYNVEEEELKTHLYKYNYLSFDKKENKFIFGNVFEERAFGEPINIMTYSLFIDLSYKILNKHRL